MPRNTCLCVALVIVLFTSFSNPRLCAYRPGDIDMCAKTASETAKKFFRKILWTGSSRPKSEKSRHPPHRMRDRRTLFTLKSETLQDPEAASSTSSAILNYEQVLAYTFLYASEQLTDFDKRHDLSNAVARADRQSVLHALLAASLHMGSTQDQQALFNQGVRCDV